MVIVNLALVLANAIFLAVSGQDAITVLRSADVAGSQR